MYVNKDMNAPIHRYCSNITISPVSVTIAGLNQAMFVASAMMNVITDNNSLCGVLLSMKMW